MKSWFFTTASNHPLGSGYWEVRAEDRAQAREIMVREKGIKWAFQYDDVNQIHHLDQKKHGVLS